jgi:hypothetical protein
MINAMMKDKVKFHVGDQEVRQEVGYQFKQHDPLASPRKVTCRQKLEEEEGCAG